MADENVTGSPETGFWRDPRARGLKSGRLSPRIPHRLPAIDRIQVARGMVNPGDVDPNQGMLFHPDQIPTKSIEDIAKEEGIPTLRPSSQRGFLPGLTGSPTGRVSSTQQKVNALTKFVQHADPEMHEGHLPEGTSTPSIASSVSRARSFITGHDRSADWYGTRAAEAIRDATRSANRDPEVTVNESQMRRAVSLFSAQRPWDTGHPQDSTYKVSNVTNVVGMPSHLAGGGTPEEYKIPAVSKGFPVAGEMVAPQTGDVQKKAAEVLQGKVDPAAPHTSSGDKVPTFDSALGYGMTNNSALKRHLSNAIVVDTHQARVVGQPDYNVVANVEGGYDVAAMVQRRASLQEGVKAIREGRKPLLPIESQEVSWEAIRPSRSLGQMSLFTESGGDLKPTDFTKVEKWKQETDKQMTEGRPAKATAKPSTKKKKR